MPDQLGAAGAAVDCARVSVERLDQHQVLAYDLAHAASAVAGCRAMLEYGARGNVESMLARVYVADAVWDLGTKILGREATWGVEAADLAPVLPFVETHRSPEFLTEVARTLPTHGTGPRHLPDDF